MIWLFDHVWLWVLISALLGFAITLFAMIGPQRTTRPRPASADRGTERLAGADSDNDATGGDPTDRDISVAAVPPAPISRRRRTYEVEDVEVEVWEPAHRFGAADDAGRQRRVDANGSFETTSEPADPAVGLFGHGAASPSSDGSAPDGYPIKASGRSMKFFSVDSPLYADVVADVCFRDEATAAAAGFVHWDPRKR